MRRVTLRRGRPWALALSLVSGLGGCAAAQRPRPSLEARPTVREVGYDSFADARRELDEHAPTASFRPLRDAVARHAARVGVARLQEGELEGAINALRTALEHYAPDELRAGGLPRELAPLARGVLDAASPRGEEAAALAANRVLALTEPPEPGAIERFEQVHQWGDTNRREYLLPWVYRGEMSDIYKEVARVVPASDVLERAATLIADRRRAALEARGSLAQLQRTRRVSMDDMRHLQAGLTATPMDMAVLYLRVGDLENAAQQVSVLAGGTGGGLAPALRAIADGEGGADGLAELASRLDPVDRAAAAGVCREGRRRYAQDARFPRCLGVHAARERDLGLASAHFEAAASLAPTSQEHARLALAAAVQWLEGELDADEPTAGRRAARRASELLTRWNAGQLGPAPLRASELALLTARLELSHGNLAGAREQMERASSEAQPVRDAFVGLAEIAWRKGEPRRAVEVLERGLALPLDAREADSTFRPLFQLRLGLAARQAGDAAAAERALTAAAEGYAALARASTEGLERAQALLLRAQALDALGRGGETRALLDEALQSAPDNRDIAAGAASFLMSRRRWREAYDVVRAARSRLQLAPQWQVYFGLWAAHCARLAGLEGDGGATEALGAIVRRAGETPSWQARLAQRFRGELEREALLRVAQTPGQRAEALFYDALTALEQRDDARARADLEGVVGTDMLRYLEYDMAWELLARGASTPAAR